MRRFPDVEFEVSPDPTAESLREAFALLMPIRRQRLRRSERNQREQEKQLTVFKDEHAQAEVTLDERKVYFKTYREQFDKECIGHQPLSELRKGLDKEVKVGEAVCEQHQVVRNSEIRCETQAQQVENAKLETRHRQRELEKLEYLMEESKELL